MPDLRAAILSETRSRAWPSRHFAEVVLLRFHRVLFALIAREVRHACRRAEAPHAESVRAETKRKARGDNVTSRRIATRTAAVHEAPLDNNAVDENGATG